MDLLRHDVQLEVLLLLEIPPGLPGAHYRYTQARRMAAAFEPSSFQYAQASR